MAEDQSEDEGDNVTVQEKEENSGIDMPDAFAVPIGRENQYKGTAIPEVLYSPATTGSPAGFTETSGPMLENAVTGWHQRTKPRKIIDLFTSPGTKFARYKENENVNRAWERSRRVTLGRGIRLPGVETRGPRTAVHIDPFLKANFIAETALPLRLRRYQRDLPAEITPPHARLNAGMRA